MNYIGSKLKLSSWIKEEVQRVAGSDLSGKTFCDIFAGTGIVGRVFKPFVKKVISNDLEEYSFVLNKNYILNSSRLEDKERLIGELDALPLCEDGFIYRHYCLGSRSGRQYFSDENGKKIDAIRRKIEEWYKTGKIGDSMYHFLLSSLLESADKVANTASIYGAFLKHLKKSAQKKLVLESADFGLSEGSHEVYKEDANVLIKKIKGDILYLDPPYNQRQYGANYHLLNTIALYDAFVPSGKTGMREYNRSNYCRKNEVEKNFELLHYRNFLYLNLRDLST